MILIRDIMYCKPGKARAMVEKFTAVARLGEKIGLGRMRVMTDLTGERYWTVVAEMEADSLERYTDTSRQAMENKDMQEVMKGYHDLVDYGRREIYTLEN